ncbi:hypothetical protein ACKKBG_A36155 [Auxenochlorella protothecoides x Auxenochlorella symbiontica]
MPVTLQRACGPMSTCMGCPGPSMQAMHSSQSPCMVLLCSKRSPVSSYRAKRIPASPRPTRNPVATGATERESPDADEEGRANPETDSLSLLDTLVESIDPAQANPTPASGPTPKKTLAERLELAYNGEEGSELAALRKRQNARQQRMDEESGRSNLPLFAGLLLLFVLPALFILVAASQSGYLDHLANGWGARSSY